jgi:hypothetical protein
MSIGKRSKVDWSQHEHSCLPLGNDCVIDELSIPGKGAFKSVKFINSQGIMAVTGDYGVWVFNREFIPSSQEGEVIEHYWCEKAPSCHLYDFDPEATHALITEWKNELMEVSEGQLSDNDRKRIEYWDACDEIVDQDSPMYYQVRACDLKPSFLDYDEVPYQKSIKPWLLVVFDAWEEICRRMREG